MTQILQNHYVLAVHNTQIISQFFVDLGFTVVNEPPGWIFVKKDNCMIMLGLCSDAIPVSELGDHNYFAYLRVDDVDSYYQDLVANEVTILSPIQSKPWGMREFSVQSPEGHRINIGQIIDI